MNDQQLGQHLADALSSQTQSSPAVAIAILHDLLGADVSLLAPLKDLVSRPGFQALTATRGGNGSALAQRHALLEALAETYQPQVIDRLGAFLDGVLCQSSATAAPGPSASPSTSERSVPVRAIAFPETVILDEGASVPPAVSFSQTSAKSLTAEGPSTPPAVGHQQGTSTPAGQQGNGRREINKGLLILVIGVALAGLAGVGVLRANLLCAPLGLCSAASIQRKTLALESAQKAAHDLEKATNLATYKRSLNELERQLNKIDHDAGLTDTQRSLRKRLRTQTGQGHNRVAKEANYQLTVQQVSKESKTTGKLAPQTAEEKRNKLHHRLKTVPKQSFAFSEAQKLQQQLKPPIATLPQASQPSVPSWQPKRSGHVWQPPHPAPVYRSRWATESYSSGPSTGGGGAPLREEPLW